MLPMLKKTIKFFDKLEDKVRARLSRHPIVYSLIGGVAVVLFWRGVWMTADEFEFLTGPVSILISVFVLLLIGLFASFFVGDQIVISGLRKEKKLIEKTEEEVRLELSELPGIKSDLERIEREVRHIERITEANQENNNAAGETGRQKQL